MSPIVVKCAAADCTLEATNRAIYQLRNLEPDGEHIHSFWAWVRLCPSHSPAIPPILEGMDLRSIIQPISEDDE